MTMETQTTTLIKIAPSSDSEVQAFYNQALQLREYAEARVIATFEDLMPATIDLSLIAKIKKGIEEKRKEYVQPLQFHVKEINDAFKALMEPIETADKITRQKILAFNAEQDRIRREQEEVNRLRMEAAQKEMELKGELTESVDLVEVSPEAPKRTITDMGTAGMRDNWTYEVIDFALLPNEYKIVDTTMLNIIAKKYHDQKQISGVRFFNKPILAVKAR